MNITSISEWLRMTDGERGALLAGPDSAAWIEALARYGFAEAQVFFGQLLLDRQTAMLTDPWWAEAHPTRVISAGAAFGWFEAAARAGYAPAINMMGRCLEYGWDVAADPAAAADCYRRAGEAGYDWGQFNLGCVLLYGIGTARDRVEAFDWFGRAAEQGLAKAMNMLGRFHEEGWDRQASRHAAAHWYGRAADGGDYRGMFNLASLLHRQDRRAEAAQHLRAAIDAGSPDFLAEAAHLLSDNDDPVFRALGEQAATLRAERSRNCRRAA